MVTEHPTNQLERFLSAVAGRPLGALVAALPDADARRLAERLSEDRRCTARQVQALAAALVHASDQLDRAAVQDLGWLMQSLGERVELYEDLQVMIENRLAA